MQLIFKLKTISLLSKLLFNSPFYAPKKIIDGQNLYKYQKFEENRVDSE